MKFVEGHFYQDADGDVWQADGYAGLVFAANGNGLQDVTIGDVRRESFVEDEYGPMTEVRPIGWEEV